MGIHSKFNGNPPCGAWDSLANPKMLKAWRQWRKGHGIIIKIPQGLCMCVQHFMAIHSIIVEICQSGLKWWTERSTKKWLYHPDICVVSMAKKVAWNFYNKQTVYTVDYYSLVIYSMLHSKLYFPSANYIPITLRAPQLLLRILVEDWWRIRPPANLESCLI